MQNFKLKIVTKQDLAKIFLLHLTASFYKSNSRSVKLLLEKLKLMHKICKTFNFSSFMF